MAERKRALVGYTLEIKRSFLEVTQVASTETSLAKENVWLRKNLRASGTLSCMWN